MPGPPFSFRAEPEVELLVIR